ncbi:MAG: efflux RND transporter permease subunit [Planctomycetota bacterium]
MNLPRACVERPIATCMFTLIVVLIGAFALLRLPIDILPEVTFPTVTVRSEYGNASPEEMERLVTEKIENTVSLVAGMDEITSESGEGSSNVRVRFGWGTDLDAAANDIRDRIDRVTDELPEDMPRPRLSKYDISASPIVILGVSSPLDPVELSTLVEDQILFRFESIEGVAGVDMWGESYREIRIELDLAKIRALNLPLEDITNSIREANVNLPGGEIEQGQYEVTIRTPGEFTSVDQIRDLVVAVRDRGPITVGDVATIFDGAEEKTRIVRMGGNLGVRLAVRKQSDANTAEVADKVMAAVELANEELPQVDIIVIRDQGRYIETAIANVARSVVYGGGLAILVLLIFLRDLRSTLTIALSIPISLLATFALIYFAGFTLNLMTLGGLALGIGMMVDSSIVVLENIFRRERENHEHSRSASVKGAGEVASAIVASTATTLVIFLPLAFVQGVSGLLFRELALTVAISLGVSLIVALTLVPMLSATLIKEAASGEKTNLISKFINAAGDKFFGAIEAFYIGVLRDALRARVLTVLLAAAMLTGSIFLVPKIGSEFLPPSDEGEVSVTGVMEVGTKLEIVEQQTKKIEEIVYPIVGDDLRSSYTSVGASSYNPSDAAEGEVDITLVPATERSRSNTEIAEELREALEGQIAGMEIRTRAPQGQRLLERLLGGSESLQIEIRGFELSILDALAVQVEQAIKDVPGVENIRLSREAGVPQQLVRIDRQKAADLGVSVRAIAQTLETALSGRRAGGYREGGNEHDILVRLQNAKQTPIEEILDLTVPSNQGENVSLRNLVTIDSARGPLVIDRKAQQRIATVSAAVEGRDMGSVAEDIKRQLATIPKPVGYELTVAGSYEEQQESAREMQLTFILAIILVYMVLASQYESLRDPLVVMLSVPIAAVGVFATLFLTKTTFNLQSYIGFIMLGGIVVNNAILLVDQAGRLRRQGMHSHDALVEAGRRRLRPILMTSLTTILGLMPLALGIGEGAEAQAPLARAVVGGLTFSTLVTLVLVPAVYSLVHPEGRGGKKTSAAGASASAAVATAG